MMSLFQFICGIMERLVIKCNGGLLLPQTTPQQKRITGVKSMDTVHRLQAVPHSAPRVGIFIFPKRTTVVPGTVIVVFLWTLDLVQLTKHQNRKNLNGLNIYVLMKRLQIQMKLTLN